MSPDVLYLSLGTTRGLRVADRALIGQLERAGAAVEAVAVRIGALDPLRRGYPLNDIVEALAARRALAAALARASPRSVLISTVTAAFFAPPMEPPFAIRFDSPAALNRPGRRNRPLIGLERRACRRARLLVPFSAAGLAPLEALGTPAVVVPPPILPSGDGAERRADLAVAYTPDPKAKGLDLLCSAWGRISAPGARLEIFGIDPERARAHLAATGVGLPSRVTLRGVVAPAEFRAALRGARLFVAAARWEDFGQAPLEALADGALLVTAPSGGAYEALAVARRLDPMLVARDMSPESLAAAIDRGFGLAAAEAESLRGHAGELLRAYSPDELDRTVERELLPALLA